jgi:steroid 5-alpha reductase family enzyme
MQIKRAFTDWYKKWFFVAEVKPRLAIGLISAAIALAAYIGLYAYRRVHENFFLNQLGWLGDWLVRYVVGLGIGAFMLFLMSGIYNLWKRRTDGNLARKDV